MNSYSEIHRQNMKSDLERQDKEWKALNRKEAPPFDWIQTTIWAATFAGLALCGAGFWYGLNWVESIFRLKGHP